MLIFALASFAAQQVVLDVNLAVSVCTQTATAMTCLSGTPAGTPTGAPVLNDVTFVLNQCGESDQRCNGVWNTSVTVSGQAFSGYVIVSESDAHYSVVAGFGPVPSLTAQLGPGGVLTNAMRTQGSEVVLNNADGSTTYLTPYLDIAPAGVPTGIQ
jgi:hypothetical protein